MRHSRFVLAFAAAVAMAAGIAGWAQGSSAEVAAAALETSEFNPWQNAAWYEAYTSERDDAYHSVVWELTQVLMLFQGVAELAAFGRAAPDAAVLRPHVLEIIRLLGGPQAPPQDLPAISTSFGPGYRLLGEKGSIEYLNEALSMYLGVVEICSDVLVAYSEAILPEGFPYPYDARAALDNQVSSLLQMMETVQAYARLALDAALRIDQRASVASQTDDLNLIFACAVTVGGYWPAPPSPWETGSQRPMREGYDPELWYLETVPSALWRFYSSFESLDKDLADAVAAAERSG
jgi:hypothetical protein